MQVEIKISTDIKEPYVVIHTPVLTPEVNSLAKKLTQPNQPLSLTIKQEDTYHILALDDLYMVRMENQQPILYTENMQYISHKKLYELEALLGDNFFRISKTTLVNLKKLDSVEPTFNTSMLLKLKNGCTDYISRKYLPEFKKYLGL